MADNAPEILRLKRESGESILEARRKIKQTEKFKKQKEISQISKKNRK